METYLLSAPKITGFDGIYKTSNHSCTARPRRRPSKLAPATVMNIENVDKKQREARFFLTKMIEQESRAFGDREPFDFYLSAFLSASRSIDYRLRHEQSAIYPAWRNSWDANLAAEDDQLIKFLCGDRGHEVHKSGSGRNATLEYSAIPSNTYSDSSGVLTVFAPPGTPQATIGKPAYYFTIGAANIRVTEACTKYLTLLDRLIADFKAAHP